MSEVTREQAFNALTALVEYITPCEVKAISNVEIARTYIAQLEQQVKDLSEVGVAYVAAAQHGLTFTKQRMAEDMKLFEAALAQGGEGV